MQLRTGGWSSSREVQAVALQHREAQSCPRVPWLCVPQKWWLFAAAAETGEIPGAGRKAVQCCRGGFLEVGSAIFAVKCITFNLTSAVQSVCTLQMAQGLCQAAGISPAPGSVHHMDAALRVLLGKPAEPGASRALALLLGPTAQAVLQSSGSEMELV